MLLGFDPSINQIMVGGVVLFLTVIGLLWLANCLYSKQGPISSFLAYTAERLGLAFMLMGLLAISVNYFDGTIMSAFVIFVMFILAISAAFKFPGWMSRSKLRSNGRSSI